MTRPALSAAVSAAILVLATSPLAAQGRWNSGRQDERLQSPRTPYGLCRVWINGVQPERQPGATGCAYAYANVPRNGHVIYGGERGELFGRRSDPYFYDRDYRDEYYRDGDDRDHDYRGRDYSGGDYRRRDYRGDGRRDRTGYGYEYLDHIGDRYSYGLPDRRQGRDGEDARPRDRDERHGRGWRRGDTHDGARHDDQGDRRDSDHNRGHGRWN